MASARPAGPRREPATRRARAASCPDHVVRPPADHGRPHGWDQPWPPSRPEDLPDLRGSRDLVPRPYLPDPDALRQRRPDVAILGVPFDDRVSHRPGARFGPRAIREATATTGRRTRWRSASSRSRCWTWSTPVTCPSSRRGPSGATRSPTSASARSPRAVPCRSILGGDHSLTWPVRQRGHRGARATARGDHPLRRPRGHGRRRERGPRSGTARPCAG